MFHRRFFLAAAAAVLTHTAHAGGSTTGDLRISQSFARETAPGQPAAAVYLTIENQGKSPDRLISAITPAAKSVELHTMTREGDVMRMREVRDITVQPGASVSMRPSEGFHLMLFGLQAPLKKGQQVPMSLTFEKAGKIDISVTVGDRGASAPAGHAHHGGAHRH